MDIDPAWIAINGGSHQTTIKEIATRDCHTMWLAYACHTVLHALYHVPIMIDLISEEADGISFEASGVYLFLVQSV